MVEQRQVKLNSSRQCNTNLIGAANKLLTTELHHNASPQAAEKAPKSQEVALCMANRPFYPYSILTTNW